MKNFKTYNESVENSLLVVDSLNLAFRWKHSKARHFVQDYVATVQSLKKSYKTPYVVIACDDGSSSYRKELHPLYKNSRKKKQELQTESEAAEFEVFIKEYSNTIKYIQENNIFPVLKFSRCEADDIAAYIVKKRKSYGISKIWLISTDRDWDLLISDYVSRFSYVTRKEVTSDNWDTHYDCTQEQYISLKCLMGDPGDDILGIEGVGPVKAKGLIDQYGSAFDVAAAIPIKSKYKYIQSVNNFGSDNILLNYKLMDLPSYCEDALGPDNTKVIDSVITKYINKDTE